MDNDKSYKYNDSSRATKIKASGATGLTNKTALEGNGLTNNRIFSSNLDPTTGLLYANSGATGNQLINN